MKHLTLLLCLLVSEFSISANPLERMIRLMINAESSLLMCRNHIIYGNLTAASQELLKGYRMLDSLSNDSNIQSYPFYLRRLAEMRREANTLQNQINNGGEIVLENDLSEMQSMAIEEEAEAEIEEENPVYPQMEDLLYQIGSLISDTSKMSERIKLLTEDKKSLTKELANYTNGVFFGLGFGYNYYVNGPYSFYLKPDSSLGRFGKTNGMSFILSGFIAYKISPKHSVIFNVPLGDITNREDYRIGLFNKKIAGGLGYGYNMGNISIVGIVNLSPYESIEYDLVSEEKFEGDRYTMIDIQNYPTSTRYSPSFTFGLSYNFIAPEKFLFNGF
jgi:hypothetical protein